MSYSESNGQVILTMSREDWQSLLMTMGIAAGSLDPESPMLARVFALLNRLNSGNPNYTPYQTGEKKC